MIIAENRTNKVKHFSLFIAEKFCAIDRCFCNENIHQMCPLQFSEMYCSYRNMFHNDYFAKVFIAAVDNRLQEPRSLYNINM